MGGVDGVRLSGVCVASGAVLESRTADSGFVLDWSDSVRSDLLAVLSPKRGHFASLILHLSFTKSCAQPGYTLLIAFGKPRRCVSQDQFDLFIHSTNGLGICSSLRSKNSAVLAVCHFTLAHCCACGLQSCTGRGYGIIVAVLHCCASQQCKSALTALAATPRATRPPL